MRYQNTKRQSQNKENHHLLMQCQDLENIIGSSTHTCLKKFLFVVNIGSNATMVDLDSPCLVHNCIYDKLLVSYYDLTCESISGFAFPEIQFFEHVGVCNNIAADFDNISSEDFPDAMSYLNFHYQVAHRNNKASGSHKDFIHFEGNRPYLLYYHLWLH